jgi:hypothetical protein
LKQLVVPLCAFHVVDDWEHYIVGGNVSQADPGRLVLGVPQLAEVDAVSGNQLAECAWD